MDAHESHLWSFFVLNDLEETPINLAAHEGHSEILKFLSSLAITPNIPDQDRLTPFYWAAQNGHIEIV